MTVPADQSTTAGAGFPPDDKTMRWLGTATGTTRNATEGYFKVEAHDGFCGGGWCVPYKRVRVVTTVHFSLG